jgi:hypothetical protein
MGVPTSEVGYTSATNGRGDHEVRKGHVVAMGGKNYLTNLGVRESLIDLYDVIQFFVWVIKK